MFYVIKEGNVYEYGDCVSIAWQCPEEAKEIPDVTMNFYMENPDRFAVVDDELVDISETEEYKRMIAEKQNSERISEIKEELAALDLKCIRAMREGGSDENGVLYLDVYQDRIDELRDELNSLE